MNRQMYIGKLAAPLLVALIAFHFVCNGVWCNNDWITIEDDMEDHLWSHLAVYRNLEDIVDRHAGIISSACAVYQAAHRPFYPTLDVRSYPPLPYFISAITNLLTGNLDLVTTRLSQMIYLALLIYSVFAIGKLCSDAACGVFAAALVSCYPAIAAASRFYTFDLPLTAVTAFSIYRLMKTNYLSALKESIVFGIALGAGILIKGQSIFFIGGPFVYALTYGILRSRKDKIQLFISVRNALIVLIIAALLSSIWWSAIFKAIFSKLFEQAFVAHTSGEIPLWLGGIMDLKPFSRDWCLSYAYFLVNNISPVLWIISLLASLAFWRLCVPHKGILITWFITAYCFFTLLPIKKDRFLMPVLPMAALVTAISLLSIKNRNIRALITGATAAFALGQFIFLSFHPVSTALTRFATKSSLFYLMTPMHRPRLIGYPESNTKRNFFESLCHAPSRSNVRAVARRLSEEMTDRPIKSQISVGYMSDNSFIMGHYDFTVAYILKSRIPHLSIYKVIADETKLSFAERNKEGNFLARGTYDYLIIFMQDLKLPDIDRISASELSRILPEIKALRDAHYSYIDSWRLEPGNCMLYLLRSEAPLS